MAESHPVDRPTVRAHKRQFFWQILLPMLLVLLLGLAVGVIVIVSTFSGSGQPRLWADVSIIWLIAPMLLFALGLLAVLGTIVYGMVKLLQVTPTYTGKTQDIFAKIAMWARKIADGMVKPFVWVRQAGAVLQNLVNILLPKK
jgi:hypothetical protein